MDLRPQTTLPGTWIPVPGPYTDQFLKLKTGGVEPSMKDSEMSKVLAEATEILSHCVSPKSRATSTAVLVVGYVQSGKTLSFTTVAALARDNGYGVVIVLAGTTKNLKAQSEDRLETDLGLSQLQSAWTLEKSPKPGDESELRRVIGNWKLKRDGKSQRDKPALLITVLKNATRIRAAASVLAKLDLTDVPVLIIDDESDQASLNTKARANLVSGGDASSGTYESIRALRTSVPVHSYLHYTATPQANLLLAISDVLNPSFVKVIESGEAYTGGQYFFGEDSGKVIRELPVSDVIDPDSPPEDIPESLQHALRIFLIGAATVGMSNIRVNRSMMVQASQKTAPHAVYHQWLTGLLASWSQILRGRDADSINLVSAEFELAYQDLQATQPALPEFSDVMDIMSEICDEVRVIQVNSVGAEKEIKWTSDQFWILVGGQKLDRGFTVEGLTVSYMPRNIAENADVLQQRARFFGYRRGYIGFCRVFIPSGTKDAFAGYVRDEQFLRDSLIANGGKPLSEWRRAFLLHQNIARLTRPNAVGRRLRRLSLDNGWVYPRSLHSHREASVRNSELTASFAAVLRNQYVTENMASLPGFIDRRVDAEPNLLVREFPIALFLEFFLSLDIRDSADQMLVTALSVALSAESGSGGTIDIVLVSNLSIEGQQGRGLAALRKNLFVGRSPDGPVPRERLRYGGDRELSLGVRPTVHLRNILLRSDEGTLSKVTWFALHFPRRLENELVIEEF